MLRRTLSVLFLGICAFAGGLVANRWPVNTTLAQGDSGPARIASSSIPEVSKLGDRFEVIARQVSPAVVYVEASKISRSPSGKSNSVEESGSGVLVRWPGRSETFVITNHHVVAQAQADQISINLADGRLLRPNRVYADPETDVALLRLEGGEGFQVAMLGDSDQARVGQWVLAFGSPFGLNQTVTHGILSARERGQVSLGTTIRIKEFLQTDAAINPGSSGGPLVNLQGEIIGINTAIASHSGSNSGVAFSIPINLVKKIGRELLEHGSVQRGYLGMQLASSFEPADAFRLGLDRVRGALVEAVYPDTPAALAGLKTDDVVLRVDDLAIKNENHLINHISGLAAGQRIRMTVWRERKQTSLEATVGNWHEGQGRFRSK